MEKTAGYPRHQVGPLESKEQRDTKEQFLDNLAYTLLQLLNGSTGTEKTDRQ